MEFVNCIVCNSKDNFHLIESVLDRFSNKKHYNILRCDCGMVMLNPRPDKREILNHYAYENYHPHNKGNGIIDILYRIAQILNNKSKLKIIKKYFKKGKTLDFGGGDGQFSHFMIKNNWEAIYYEPHLEVKKGNHIDDIDCLKDKSFDVVTMFHSIEHIHDVNKSVDEVYNLLNKNGVLILSFPNYNAYERKFFNKGWIAYDAPRHLYHFTVNSMTQFLEDRKFKIITTKPIYLDAIYNIIMSSNNFYEKVFKMPFQIFFTLLNIFIDKNKSSSLLLVCQKK